MSACTHGIVNIYISIYSCRFEWRAVPLLLSWSGEGFGIVIPPHPLIVVCVATPKRPARVLWPSPIYYVTVKLSQNRFVSSTKRTLQNSFVITTKNFCTPIFTKLFCDGHKSFCDHHKIIFAVHVIRWTLVISVTCYWTKYIYTHCCSSKENINRLTDMF